MAVQFQDYYTVLGVPPTVDTGQFRRARGPTRGNDVEGDILVTLHEVMNGAVRSVSLPLVDPRTGKEETHTFKVRIPRGVQSGQLETLSRR